MKITPKYDERDVMCLCPICSDSYRNRGYKLIPVGGESDMCNICNYRIGLDYAVDGLISRNL